MIQAYNKGHQWDSQSHTRYVCDAFYPALFITHACEAEGKLYWLTAIYFDCPEWNDLSFEEQVRGPPEYSQWEDRNS